MALGLGGQVAHQSMTLVATAGGALAGPGASVGLVYDHQLGTRPDEVVASAVGLDEVEGDDHIGIAVEYGLAHSQPALKPGGGRRQHELSIDVELVG